MRTTVIAVIAVLISLTGHVFAADVEAGKAKFAVCAGCHGPTGKGNSALNYPKIGGLKAAYVVQQLRAFKSGARASATMKAMTAALSEADMDNLGAYVATLRP